MTRDEHLDWAKKRALEYVERGDMTDAFASLVSDLNKHEGTRGHSGIQIGAQLLWNRHLDTAAQMREFILGFR